MKIIYAGIQYSFYKKEAGLSFEHNNFYLSLKDFPGVEIRYFPFDRILEVGKKKFNDELFEAVKSWQPDLLFVFMLTDEVSKRTLERVGKETQTKTLAWFSDDTWRFWSYSKQCRAYFYCNRLRIASLLKPINHLMQMKFSLLRINVIRYMIHV